MPKLWPPHSTVTCADTSFLSSLCRASFQSAVNWKQDIDAKVFLPSGAPIPVLLLGNKCDLIEDNQVGRGASWQPNAQARHYARLSPGS